jgi:hypothetical protein
VRGGSGGRYDGEAVEAVGGSACGGDGPEGEGKGAGCVEGFAGVAAGVGYGLEVAHFGEVCLGRCFGIVGWGLDVCFGTVWLCPRGRFAYCVCV